MKIFRYSFNILNITIFFTFFFCIKASAKDRAQASLNTMFGYGNLGEIDIQHTSISLEAATTQEYGLIGMRVEQIHLKEQQYKGMGANSLTQIHGLYVYEKILPNQSTLLSIKAGLPIISLGHYEITDFYDESEISAPYLPPSMKSNWQVSGEKTISSYGFWFEFGAQQMISVLSSEKFEHKIGCYLNHFFYRFDAVAGHLEAYHSNGSYMISEDRELKRHHFWRGRGLVLNYQIKW